MGHLNVTAMELEAARRREVLRGERTSSTGTLRGRVERSGRDLGWLTTAMIVAFGARAARG